MNLILILDKFAHKGIAVESSERTEEISLPVVKVMDMLVPVEGFVINLPKNHHTCSEYLFSSIAATYVELGFEIESEQTISIPYPMPKPECLRRHIIFWIRRKRFLITMLREGEFLSVTPFSLTA